MKKKATIKTYKITIVFVAFLFCVAIIKLSYIVLSSEVDGVNLKTKAESITTATKTLYSSRGDIYDINGDILAQTVNSYTVIAYLSESRTTDASNPRHVIDKEYTAEALAPILNMTKEAILELLNRDKYQVELGPGGKDITILVKKKIEELELPGIGFTTSTKRYYSNSTFASYIIGYAKTNEDGEIMGELGIEGYYNDILAGVNGSTTYQKYTSSQYQIPNTDVYTEPAKDGSNIYLTIDSNIQLIAENAINDMQQYNPEWAIYTVMDAKTGAIVASATSPSFNPNDTNTITSYLNPLVSYQYEPGSVMKIFSFATAIEEGIYKGSDTYQSGSIPVADVIISDANKTGWGEITYDTGFAYSSNVAATKLALELGINKLTNYYDALGFGKKTGIELSNEVSGSLNIQYASELANASFGQGVSVTPIQMLQALSSMANNGDTIKPYIVDKIVDSEGTVTYEGKRTVVKNIFSVSTTKKMKELMHSVIYAGLTNIWVADNVAVMGKTGTAQIASPSGGYLKGTYDYIKSFAGIFPEDDPKYIVYVVARRVQGSSRNFANVITKGVEEIANYAKVTSNTTSESLENLIEISNYISKDLNATQTLLENEKLKVIVIGNGKYIINQYPLKNIKVLSGSKLFLVTNYSEITMPNMIGWSMNEVKTYCSLINLKCNIEEYGYVITQSIAEGTIIDVNNNELTITLN